jgi:hypothetical protein
MRLRESAVANAEWVDAQRDGASTVTGRINVDLLLAHSYPETKTKLTSQRCRRVRHREGVGHELDLSEGSSLTEANRSTSTAKERTSIAPATTRRSSPVLCSAPPISIRTRPSAVSAI